MNFEVKINVEGSISVKTTHLCGGSKLYFLGLKLMLVVNRKVES